MTTGEFSNVQLSDIELNKLERRFGPAVTEAYIEKLSCWRKVNPRRAKGSCDYARLIIWIRKDLTIERFTPPPVPAPSLLDEMDLRHRAECMQRYQKREGLPVLEIEEIMGRLRQ